MNQWSPSAGVNGADWKGVKCVLIANRGECSLRIMRTCRRMGIGHVAIYCQNDVSSLHVKEAETKVQVSSYVICHTRARVAS